MKHAFTPRAAAAVAVLMAMAVALPACGGDDDSAGTGSAAGNGTDLAFVQDMIPHHESAIEMAKIAQKRGQSKFVKDLADDIVNAQESEIKTMTAARAEFEKAGIKKQDLVLPKGMAGMAEKGMADMSMLESANPFDKAFIDMMVPHHQAAIEMARAELAKGKNAGLKTLAQEIIDAQSREITAMNDHRKAEFGAISPAGGVSSAAGSADGGMPAGHQP